MGERSQFFFRQVVSLFAESPDNFVLFGVHPAKLDAILIFNIDGLFMLFNRDLPFAQLLGDLGLFQMQSAAAGVALDGE